MPATRSIVIRADRILTMGAPAVVSPGFVLVDVTGRIVAVEGARVEPPAEADLVDLGDVTLMPGLVDAHLHLGFDASSDVLTPLIELDDQALTDVMEQSASRCLDAGITTVRDLGDRRFLSLPLRERYRADVTAGPELLVAGPPLTRTKGHCWFLGGEADTEEDLRAAVDERAARGCDVVKVMATGGVITPGFLPHESQYDLAQLRAVVERARSHSLMTAAHAHGGAGIRDSVEAGVDSVEHCSFVDADDVDVDWDVVEKIAAKGIFVSATSAVLPGIEPPPFIKKRIETMLTNLQRMHELGARVVCSSDSGVAPPKPHGVLPHGIVALASGGMSNGDALAAATVVAAAACGLEGRKGRIAAGLDADLLAVHGDPMRHIDDVHDVAFVFRCGTRVR